MPVQLYKIPTPLPLLQAMYPAGCKDIECYTGNVIDAFITVIKSKDPSGPNGEYEDHLYIQISGVPKVSGFKFREPTQNEMLEILDFVGWKAAKRTRTSETRVVHLYRFDGEVADFRPEASIRITDAV
jgi:hypothetical protein